MIKYLDTLIASFAETMWGTPLLVLLLGGGFFFTIYSRFIPFRFILHGFNILLGKYDDPNDPGQISHFQALTSALASTVGMGNISGVAIAIHTGGPGALFWMWISAIVGMATKFFTCTLAILYRGKDENGELPNTDTHRDRAVLIVPCDAPMMTSQEVGYFISHANMENYDHVLGMVSREKLKYFYPQERKQGIKMAYLHLKEDSFRINNLHLVKPLRIENREYIQKMYQYRYQRNFKNLVFFWIVAFRKRQGPAL